MGVHAAIQYQDQGALTLCLNRIAREANIDQSTKDPKVIILSHRKENTHRSDDDNFGGADLCRMHRR